MKKPALVASTIERFGSPAVRRIIGNMSWLMVDRVVRLGMGLVVGVWVARYLGPEQFGGLNFAISFIALFAAATTLGLEGIVIREVLHSAEDSNEILGTTLALRVTAGFAAIGLSIVALLAIQPHDRQALVLVTILSSTLLFQSLDTIDSYLQSQVRSKISVWAKNAAFLLFAVMRVWLILKKEPLWTFAAANAGEAALGAAGLMLGYRLYGGRMTAWRATSRRAIMLLKQGWPLLFSGMAIMIYVRLDTVMLKVMQGDFAVGLYAAATRVSEVWYFVPTAIVSSVTPAILKAKGDPKLFYDRLEKLFSLMTMSACIIGALVALASPAIIRILYSNRYAGAAPILAVHVWASVFVFLGVAQSPWDLSKDLLKLSLYRTVAGAVINAAMNLYLIPRYSGMGAAIATVVSYAVSAVFANAFSAKTRPIFAMQMRSFLPWRLLALYK